MLRNYLKIALRNLGKDKLHAGINIFGLAIGFMVMILSLVYIKSEWDYDKWLPHSDRIYRSYRNFGQGTGGWVGMPGPLARTLEESIPGVEKATHINEVNRVLFSKAEQSIYVEKVGMVDSTFFQVFQFPFLHGDVSTALDDQKSLVITQKVAKQFFGKDNPIGKTLKISGEEDLLITGVLKETSQKSHLEFDVFLRLNEQNWDTWLNYGLSTYVLVNPKVAIQEIEEKSQAHLIPLIVNAWKENNQIPDIKQLGQFRFQPLQDVHLYSKGFGAGISNSGDIQNLKIFGIIAFIVLFIAAINYMNLATAKAANRAKEVGMRKVAGAKRGQLVTQFLAESAVQSLLALSIALVLAESILPVFNQITGRSLQFFAGDWLGFLPALLGICLIIGLLAGIYPAFILSAYKPIKVLKGHILKNKHGQTFRKTLVVTQFSISVVLIIFMLFVFQQVDHMQQQELGFEGEQVVNIPINEYASIQDFEARKNTFLNILGVIHAALSSHIPGEPPGGMTIEIEGVEGMQGADMIWTAPDFDKTLGLKLAKGRFFSTAHPNDTANAIIVNEAFLDYYKIADPLQTRIKLFGQNDYAQVVGVLEDFHLQGLQSIIHPTFFIYRPNWMMNYVSVKIAPENMPQTLAAIEKEWASIEPAHPVEMTFLDQKFAKQYQKQQQFGQTMFYATALAILISILGLFGLASFMAEQRTKEIGVRKVLGATLANLIQLLLTDFVKLVLIAGVIALPFGYYVVHYWLQDFAFRTDITVFPFIIAIFAAVFLTILTVSYQSIKVAVENPIEALKVD